jgi:hypothetical protein
VSVLWRRRDVPGLEWCELRASEVPTALRGVVVLAWQGTPWNVSYSIELDDVGRTRHAVISANSGLEPVVLDPPAPRVFGQICTGRRLAALGTVPRTESS